MRQDTIAEAEDNILDTVASESWYQVSSQTERRVGNVFFRPVFASHDKVLVVCHIFS